MQKKHRTKRVRRTAARAWCGANYWKNTNCSCPEYPLDYAVAMHGCLYDCAGFSKCPLRRKAEAWQMWPTHDQDVINCVQFMEGLRLAKRDGKQVVMH